MRFRQVLSVVLAAGVVLTQARAQAVPEAASMTDEQKTLYALGLSIERSLAGFSLSDQELEMVKRGLTEGHGGKATVDLEQWGPSINKLMQSRAEAVSSKEKEAGAAFIEKAAAEPGAVKTDKGYVYQEITAGKGASPAPEDTVRVHYRGTLANGKEFDSSYKRGQPAAFALNQVVPCWTLGVQKMKVGGKARLVCPSELAYGDRGAPPDIPGGAALSFEIELIAIQGK